MSRKITDPGAVPRASWGGMVAFWLVSGFAVILLNPRYLLEAAACEAVATALLLWRYPETFFRWPDDEPADRS